MESPAFGGRCKPRYPVDGGAVRADNDNASASVERFGENYAYEQGEPHDHTEVPMTPKPCLVIPFLILSGCCLDATVSSGTGDTRSTSIGEAAVSTGTGAGSGTGSGAVSGSGTGTATVGGTGTTTGTCGAMALTVSPNPIDFSYVPPSSLAIGCTVLSNPCLASMSITGVADLATAGGVFAVASTDDFPIAIGGGAHAQVCFSFTPPAPGDYMGQATLLTSDPSGENPVVQLTGWGGGPEIFCTPLTLAFGSVGIGDASTLSVICTNTGSAAPGVLPPLLIGPLDAGGGVFSAAFDTEINSYPSGGLAPAQSAQIDVTYAPIDSTDEFGVLAIPNNGGERQTPYISLSGRGY